MRRFAAVFVLMFFISLSMAFSQTGTEQSTPVYTAMDQQNEFLDSLVHVWYFKRAEVNGVNKKYEPTFRSTAPVVLSDSATDLLYTERLKTLPMIFPMSYNEDVKSWIELYKRNRRTPYLIGLSDYYFPIFEEILDSYDIPTELKYLSIIESALNPRATSRAGAVGLWQFMYSTGKMYGLEVNSYVDERRDPLKATHAAAQFLKDMYEVYGDWTLVIAAYNCGPGNVNKAIRRANGKTDFWEIYQYLPKETRGYVPAYIGALYTMEYHDEHGIVPVKPDMNLFTDTIMITQKLHLMQVSEMLNIPLEELAELNPQYRKDIIPGHVKPYPLRLPVKRTGDFIALQQEIYNYKDSVFLDKRAIAVSPPQYKQSKTDSYSYGTTESKYTPPSTAGKQKLAYTVKQGDTYGYISSWFGVKISDVKYWNNVVSNKLSVGQELEIWVPIKKYDHYAKLDALTFEQKQAASEKLAVNTPKVSGSKTGSTPKDNTFVWHKIQQGDNLWTISQRYPGVSDQDIKRINGFTNADLTRLQTGQYIKIKKK